MSDCLVEQITVLLEYLDIFAWFCADSNFRCFFMNFSTILHKKICEFWLLILEDHPIIPKLFLILFTTNYSKKYSSIMYVCLLVIYLSDTLLLDILGNWIHQLFDYNFLIRHNIIPIPYTNNIIHHILTTFDDILALMLIKFSVIRLLIASASPFCMASWSLSFSSCNINQHNYAITTCGTIIPMI